MENEDLIAKIKQRTEVLEDVRVKLKEKFIGIDHAIDQIINNISLWYITPEFQFKPIIVNLWGITGVGKTDLVRTLVSLLKFNDYFIEIQMDVKNPYKKNIEDYIDGSGITHKDSVIVLLDEFQRFRTIDENGKMLQNNEYYNDIWQLLSDGKFQNKSQIKHELTEMLMDELYYKDINDNSETPPITNETTTDSDKQVAKKIRKFNTSAWSANRLKRKLKLDVSLEDIMLMTFEQKVQLINDTIKSGNANESQSYEKMLIFISGNLDEAYYMAEDVENAEADADIIHEMSKQITVIDIKGALLKKFKPEQIARLGNNHIIYPCLDRKSYEKIIDINCNKIFNKIKSTHGTEIKITSKLAEIIYRNGVFPTQGVRPVITTIYNILGNNIPFFIYYAKLNNVENITIDINNSTLFTKIHDKVIGKDVVLDIDNIKNKKDADELTLTLVHEIGHALVYALSFGIAPAQININSSNNSEGFVMRHSIIHNKNNIKKTLCVMLAGQVAEEIVFNDEYKSKGSEIDIRGATTLASNYVRAYGMDGSVSKIFNPNISVPEQFNYDIDKTNQSIETLMIDAKNFAENLIKSNLKLFKELINHGKTTKMMNIGDFIEICKKYKLEIDELGNDMKIIHGYSQALNDFLSN